MTLRLSTALLLGLLLASCGSDEPPPPEPVATPAEAAGGGPDEGPEDPVDQARAKIDADGLLAHIEVLASDEFGGREPMTEGERLTLDYLETRFRELGLEPLFGDSYRQPVPLVSIDAGDAAPLAVRLPGGGVHAFEYGPEVMLWTSRMVDNIELDDSELVWVGYGIVAPEYDWNDYQGVDVTGKTVVMLVNDPGFATGDPALFNGRAMTYYGRWTYKYEEAARQGAAGALIVHQAAPASYGWNVVEDSNKGPQYHLAAEDGNMDRVQIEGWLQYPVAKDIFALARQDLDDLIERAAEGPVTPTPLGVTASTRFTNRLQRAESFNIGAVVPGRERPDELFLYMAHWDHIGTAENGAPGEDVIYNGAADNASGTAALLELAEAFMTPGLEPERSIGFLAVTAEESGLLGSKAYAENPPVPLNRTVAGINMDVLNFIDRVSDISVVGHGSSEMEDLLAEVAAEHDRTVTPEGSPERGSFYRSDHFNFAKKGVPVLYARGGTQSRDNDAEYMARRQRDYTENRYHAVDDEVQDDWNLQAAIDDLRLFFDLGLRVADSDDWPEWYEGNEFRAAREASMAGTGTAGTD